MLTRFFAATATAAVLAISFSPSAHSQTFTANQYAQTNLVGDLSGTATVTDPNLRNAWGVSRSSTGDWWIADTGSGLSTLYSGTTGAITPLVVTIPPSDPTVKKTGNPTGTVFNGTSGFPVAPGKPAAFLFASLDGSISGWNPAVDHANAITTVREKSSAFTGLTMATATLHGVTATYLYAADVRGARIAVYDANFNHATGIENSIAKISVPADYAPYNVQNLGGNIYIAYGVKGSNGFIEHAPGAGIVIAIYPEGGLIGVAEAGSFFNAPWGMAIAPSDFGAYSHDLLVGNFGDGTISAFNPITGKFLGKLQDKTGAPIVIPGLWALSVGNGTELGGSAISVFFTAGPNNQQDGLFGSLSALANPFGNDQ